MDLSLKRYDFSELSVLCVDDSKNMHRFLRAVFGAMKIRDVRYCENGQEGYEELKRKVPDLVIVDYEMAPVNGVEFTRKVRRDEDSPDPYLPILMLTGHGDRARIMAARDAGVTEVLAKPISVKALYARLVHMVEHERPFIKAREYVGPDRRRRSDEFGGDEKRTEEDEADLKPSRLAADRKAKSSSDEAA